MKWERRNGTTAELGDEKEIIKEGTHKSRRGEIIVGEKVL